MEFMIVLKLRTKVDTTKYFSGSKDALLYITRRNAWWRRWVFVNRECVEKPG